MRINIRDVPEYEDLISLPSRVTNSLFEEFNKEHRYGLELRQRRRTWHKVGDYNPWTIAERVIENNIGKPFDEAFSYYCKLVPVYQQNVFLEEFNLGRQYYRHLDYRIDEEGLIQRKRDRNKYKGPYTFYSRDYRVEERHIETGKLKPEDRWWSKKYKVDDSMYVKVVASGFSETFDSKKDRRYKRLTAEKYKEYLRNCKARKKRPDINEHDFRRILKEKELKEREENLIKILSHGFDPVTSFRKRKKED
jgi:hypothetical protein